MRRRVIILLAAAVVVSALWMGRRAQAETPPAEAEGGRIVRPLDSLGASVKDGRLVRHYDLGGRTERGASMFRRTAS